jgi:galactose mutarotase-like enzyme
MAFEPCIGAPDSLTEAIGGWKSAAWLEPGETREWTLTWQGRRVL